MNFWWYFLSGKHFSGDFYCFLAECICSGAELDHKSCLGFSFLWYRHIIWIIFGIEVLFRGFYGFLMQHFCCGMNNHFILVLYISLLPKKTPLFSEKKMSVFGSTYLSRAWALSTEFYTRCCIISSCCLKRHIWVQLDSTGYLFMSSYKFSELIML